jgi:hypothetical protein
MERGIWRASLVEACLTLLLWVRIQLVEFFYTPSMELPNGSGLYVRDCVDSKRTSAAIKCLEGVMDPGSRYLAVIVESASVLSSRGSQDGYGLDVSVCYISS